MLHAPLLRGEATEPSPIRLRVLSLGAGVQSTATGHGQLDLWPNECEDMCGL